ncbi:RIO1 family protein kinase [Penicillium hispanicum]|uniref:RIO1 family protein kinase n=1 Tax=Penicillium hispanicum TaxID=1080232 RepID=UPI002540AAA7|nr:RIO1 family protein kinase [Penicillium hispanicum]KAJ5587321.1 RIO1 family protein kinase [Penicillium hispanicum]
MKLDAKAIRYLTSEDFRVLAAVEAGSRNHEVVPTPLIAQLSGLRGGSGVNRAISNLAKTNLIAKVKNAKYDGYRLTYGGLDYLALNAHQKQKCVYSVGNQIGVGKESDIIVVAHSSGTQRILKIHRLGRISFRTVKTNRDYLRHRNTGSWMYMSRLAAMKEFAFMKALRENGFSVPEPIAQNRHTIVMSLIDAFPLRQISKVPQPAVLYSELMDMILELARFGLIHGDFNEFNILIKEEADPNCKGKAPADAENEDDENVRLVPVLIDFPQMVSIDHVNAEMYFDRDVNCIKRFFQRKFHFVSDAPGPFFKDARKNLLKNPGKRLDVEVEASGFSRKMARELENYMKEVGADGAGASKDDDNDDDDDDDDEEEEEEENSSDEEEEEESGEANEGERPEQENAEVDDSSRRFESLQTGEDTIGSGGRCGQLRSFHAAKDHQQLRFSINNHTPSTMVRKTIGLPKGVKNSFLPVSQRKQVFLPEFVISLVRTPNLSPRYAQFRVPLNFNKLDMRDYLERVYGVGVISVRSYVEQLPITRLTRDGRNIGPWRRQLPEKRMTVELREPFIWPEEPTDLTDWEKESWDSSERFQQEMRKQTVQKQDSSEEPDHKLRKAFEEQAQELKENKEEWRPTWQALGLDFAHREFVRSKGSNNPAPKWMKP